LLVFVTVQLQFGGGVYNCWWRRRCHSWPESCC